MHPRPSFSPDSQGPGDSPTMLSALCPSCSSAAIPISPQRPGKRYTPLPRLRLRTEQLPPKVQASSALSSAAAAAAFDHESRRTGLRGLCGRVVPASPRFCRYGAPPPPSPHASVWSSPQPSGQSLPLGCTALSRKARTRRFAGPSRAWDGDKR